MLLCERSIAVLPKKRWLPLRSWTLLIGNDILTDLETNILCDPPC